MMSCGISSRYGSNLLLKTADFSIQDVTVSVRGENSLSPNRRGSVSGSLFCGLFKRPQHGIAAGRRGIECFLGGFLPGKCGLEFLGPEFAHLHHVAEAQAT